MGPHPSPPSLLFYYNIYNKIYYTLLKGSFNSIKHPIFGSIRNSNSAVNSPSNSPTNSPNFK